MKIFSKVFVSLSSIVPLFLTSTASASAVEFNVHNLVEWGGMKVTVYQVSFADDKCPDFYPVGDQGYFESSNSTLGWIGLGDISGVPSNAKSKTAKAFTDSSDICVRTSNKSGGNGKFFGPIKFGLLLEANSSKIDCKVENVGVPYRLSCGKLAWEGY